MLKQSVAVLAIALAGAASAAGWKELRVDASSDEAFAKSLQTFYEELSWERRHVFSQALTDIWLKGTEDGNANQREYTVADYHSQLDGLSYEEVVTLTDPTGETAKERYREAKRMNAASGAPPPVSPWQAARNEQAARDGTMLNQGSEASPTSPALSGVPGISISTRNRETSCGGNAGGCER